jgi:Ca2+-transporting ATPase
MENTIPKKITEDLNGDSWHAVEADEVLARLATYAEKGLSNEEAQRRLDKYGPNELEEAPPVSFWQMLGEQPLLS